MDGAAGAEIGLRDSQGGVQFLQRQLRPDGPLSGVVLFDGGGDGQGLARVDSSEPLAGFRAPAETRSGDRVVRTGVGVMNPEAEEKTLQVRLFDLEGAVVGTGAVVADPLPGNGHVARFVDEFIWDEPAPDLTDFQGGPGGRCIEWQGVGHGAEVESRESGQSAGGGDSVMGSCNSPYMTTSLDEFQGLLLLGPQVQLQGGKRTQSLAIWMEKTGRGQSRSLGRIG